MNNKTTKNSNVAMGTPCFVYLLMGVFLLLSCGTDDHPAEGSNSSKQYLAFNQYGLTNFMIAKDAQEEIFSLAVKRIGGMFDSELTAKLDVWSEDELAAYNEKEKTTYTSLPESFYSLSSKEVAFASGATETNVEIKIKSSEIFFEQMEQKKDYVIALKLISDKAELKKRQCDLLLHFVVASANVGFASAEVERVNVDEMTTRVEILTSLDYKVGGKESGSDWDFYCDLQVPENASELVVAYNQANNSNYELLPSNSYNLGKVDYRVGDKTAEGILSIDRRTIEVKYYLLPLTLANVSIGTVLCKEEVHYMVVGQTYTNPIITESSVGDPTVIRAEDGYFYLYATQTDKYWVPIYRSSDLVDWKYMKTAFQNATKPQLPGGGAFWAPEVRRVNGKYVIYFSWAKLNGTSESYTAVAFSDNPLGPFPDSKALLTNDEFGSNCIDQFYFEEDGKKYMFYGSFRGIFVVELTEDGLSVKRDESGVPVLKNQVCGNDFEATNIYKKNGYYYLFASIGSCCAGANSSYSVVVGRSASLLGPYVDKKGKGMIDNSWEPVVDGGDRSKWVGPGHNAAIIQDDAGTDWMIYHSYIKTGNTVGGRLGMLNRLQWTSDGWPYVKGYTPSETDLIPIFHNKP